MISLPLTLVLKHTRQVEGGRLHADRAILHPALLLALLVLLVGCGPALAGPRWQLDQPPRWSMVLEPPSRQGRAQATRRKMHPVFWKAADSLLAWMDNDSRDSIRFSEVHHARILDPTAPRESLRVHVYDLRGTHDYLVWVVETDRLTSPRQLARLEFNWSRLPARREIRRVWPTGFTTDYSRPNLADTSWGAKFDSLITERDSLDAFVTISLDALARPLWLPRARRWTHGPDEVAKLTVAASFFWVRELTRWRPLPPRPGLADARRAWDYAEDVVVFPSPFPTNP